MNEMLKRIIEANKEDLNSRKKETSQKELEEELLGLPECLDFKKVFETEFGIIAEIKLASPSTGDLIIPGQILQIVEDYKKGGAKAISVVTEKQFFKGDIKLIKVVKQKTGLPVLQKDFVVDKYQIFEARIAGADGLLLIAKLLSSDQIEEFVEICFKLGMEPVVEIYDEEDLIKVKNTKTRIMAVNARDLNTFEININKACELLDKISDKFLKLGFSGINTKEEAAKYKKAGARGILIGSSLIKALDRVKFLEDLSELASLGDKND